MTVYELKELLNNFNDNDTILVKSRNSSYVENIRNIANANITAMWSDDFKAVVIGGNEQVGSI